MTKMSFLLNNGKQKHMLLVFFLYTLLSRRKPV